MNSSQDVLFNGQSTDAAKALESFLRATLAGWTVCSVSGSREVYIADTETSGRGDASSFVGGYSVLKPIADIAAFWLDANQDASDLEYLKGRVAGWFLDLSLGRAETEFLSALALIDRPGRIVRCSVLAAFGVADPVAISKGLAASDEDFIAAATGSCAEMSPQDAFRALPS